MKKLILLFVTITLSLILSAQTQQGYVKTKGRMIDGKYEPGQGLKGATVSIQGITLVVVKNNNGSFSFPIPAKTFMVKSVQKNGYQLVDEDAIRKSYDYSSNPIYLVMETPEQQLQDKLDAERKIRRTLQRTLEQREDELKALKDAQRITVEEYRQDLEELYANQRDNDKLIEKMAKQYAQMDYDQMDDLNQRISDAILNGRLAEADSLLRSKGDLKNRIDEIRNEQQAEAQREVEIAQEQKDLDEAKVGTQKKLEDVASDCYKLFDLCKLKMEWDSAAYYIALRAELDTINVEWQFEAGEFNSDYWQWTTDKDRKKSLLFFNRAALSAKQAYGTHPITAKCYHKLGIEYHMQKYYNKAIESFSEGLSISNLYYGEVSSFSLSCLEELGNTYRFIDEYDSSTFYYEKAYRVAEKLRKKCAETARLDNVDDSAYFSFEKNDAMFYAAFDYSLICNGRASIAALRSIANNYNSQNDAASAIAYSKQAIKLLTTLFGNNSEDVYDDLGSTANYYEKCGNYPMAIQYYESRLQVAQNLILQYKNNNDYGDWYKEFGKGLEYTATMDLACCYKKNRDYLRAIELFTQLLPYHGEKGYHNPAILRDIGESYLMKGEPDSAVANYNQGLTISKDILLIPAYEKKTLKSIAFFDNDVLSLLSDSVGSAKYQSFFSGLVFVCNCLNGDTPARQEGLTGNYILLEFDDWTQNSKTWLFDKNEELRGRPKDILVMKDGIISQHHFENSIGALLEVRYVGIEEKQRINKAYDEWKKQNRQ